MRPANILASTVIAFVLLPVAAFAQSATLNGMVKTPLTLDQATLSAFTPTTINISFETSKGKETGTYTGVLLWDLLGKAELVNDEGKNAALKHTLLITGSDGYAVAVALGELDPNFAGKQVLVAYDGSGATYDDLRVLVPGDLHGGRAVKDVVSIEVK